MEDILFGGLDGHTGDGHWHLCLVSSDRFIIYIKILFLIFVNRVSWHTIGRVVINKWNYIAGCPDGCTWCSVCYWSPWSSLSRFTPLFRLKMIASGNRFTTMVRIVACNSESIMMTSSLYLPKVYMCMWRLGKAILHIIKKCWSYHGWTNMMT